VVGLVAGVALSRAIGAILLSSFAQLNPALFVAVALPLIAVALLGAYAPARRASLIDPIRALRDE
jgi:ABC-type antimicrobial peptide transport system permease subunit